MTLTVGECIDYALLSYANAGSDNVTYDDDLRKRAWILLSEMNSRVYHKAPWHWRRAAGTVSLSAGAGYGTVPADWQSMGSQGTVTISGQTLAPLRYLPPGEMATAKAATNLTSDTPTHYSFYGATDGVPHLQVYPSNGSAVTLALANYVKRCPDMVDRPKAPTTAEGAAGNLTGTYQYKQTNVTASGETEPGPASVALTVAAKAITVTIQVSPVHRVTSRKLYRTEDAGVTWNLVTTVSDNSTTTYSDDTADVSAGASPPDVTTAITGLEVWPEDMAFPIFMSGLARWIAKAQGDVRDQAWLADWEGQVRQFWSDYKPGQEQPEAFPPYGTNRSSSSARRRWAPVGS